MKIKIIEVGQLVNEFKDDKIFILFGVEAPPELKDFSVIIDFKRDEIKEYFKVGGMLIINNIEYEIEKVGEVANDNFNKLGHVAVHIGSNESVLPGSIHVKDNSFPTFKENDIIEIIA
ncbi:PTS glucitol/sorbitol transporter subunit IIA [Anaerococcus sp. AGMB00486]|uniref:PTS glucitol/sorbitol transporter subunit IIA n=2 Tax=Anaerococcus TaxID=165779 RepID=A0ABX2NA85_9FIRM|nr:MULTISPECIES: PTS glucitol/sorbitol transporter subunit IIA [Anaerococcus]MSS77744.1 PTS sorbitol transporter subunit IIA [Anaerococcus porci]NVF11599.1 PTS glucitol/sorbitol transporter subunit IIA [Anaerococcus faecalis]